MKRILFGVMGTGIIAGLMVIGVFGITSAQSTDPVTEPAPGIDVAETENEAREVSEQRM